MSAYIDRLFRGFLHLCLLNRSLCDRLLNRFLCHRLLNHRLLNGLLCACLLYRLLRYGLLSRFLRRRLLLNRSCLLYRLSLLNRLSLLYGSAALLGREYIIGCLLFPYDALYVFQIAVNRLLCFRKDIAQGEGSFRNGTDLGDLDLTILDLRFEFLVSALQFFQSFFLFVQEIQQFLSG